MENIVLFLLLVLWYAKLRVDDDDDDEMGSAKKFAFKEW